jgi:hypothetical protein
MTRDRFEVRDGFVWDTQTEAFCTPTGTLMACANAWARFLSAMRSLDESVGDVLERARLED